MDPWKMRFLLENIISRFHVEFQGCTTDIQVVNTKKEIEAEGVVELHIW